MYLYNMYAHESYVTQNNTIKDEFKIRIVRRYSYAILVHSCVGIKNQYKQNYDSIFFFLILFI